MVPNGRVVRANDRTIVRSHVLNHPRVIDAFGARLCFVCPLATIRMSGRNARLVGIVSVCVMAARLAALATATHEFSDRESLKLLLDETRPRAPFFGCSWF